MKTVRTRFAPSPTGLLHIGGVRTAMYAYAWAKHNNGTFVVRVEDTDLKRKIEGAIDKMFNILEVYGLHPDESLKHGGDFGPYLQSQRSDIYLKYAKELITKGFAYYCFLEGEELESYKKLYRGKGFRSPFRDQPITVSEKMVKDGIPHVIRMKVPDNEIINHTDGVQGSMKFDSNLVGEEVLIKSNGIGSYHLAVVVDDHLMQITHVIRAFEWLPSTPKQILLHRYLGWEMPPYYHVTAILDPEGGKLSKRKGSVSAEAFLEGGYLVDAILNFLMLLGWSSPEKREYGEKEKEFFTLQEFVDLFDVKDFNKANPVFDRTKLSWFNKEYIKNLSEKDLVTKFLNWIKNYATDKSMMNIYLKDNNLSKKLQLVKERSTTLLDASAQMEFFYTAKVPDWDIDQVQAFKEKIFQIKEEIYTIISSMDNDSSKWVQEDWVSKMREINQKYGLKGGDSFMVLRMCIVGSPYSPPLFEAMQLMSKDEILERLK